MRLQSDRELENTRSKLLVLEELIRAKMESKVRSGAYEISLKSMNKMASQLREEIREYEAAHQTN